MLGDWDWRVPENARNELNCVAVSEEGLEVGEEAIAIGVSWFLGLGFGYRERERMLLLCSTERD